jgi:hypothetical protein
MEYIKLANVLRKSMIKYGFLMIFGLPHFQASSPVYFSGRLLNHQLSLGEGGLRLYAVALHCIFAVVMCLFMQPVVWVGVLEFSECPFKGNPGIRKQRPKVRVVPVQFEDFTGTFWGFTWFYQMDTNGDFAKLLRSREVEHMLEVTLNCAGMSRFLSHTARRRFR